jgi:unsaturated chondroitin disaccharide hydrolase
MFKAAIEDALTKTKRNIPRFRGLFPHVSVNNRYLLNENKEWTCGFWPGLLWLSYEYSKDNTFLHAAEQTVAELGLRLKNKDSLEHHDIGFLYSLSAKAQWIIQKEVPQRRS